jgi:hypothetical protein
MPTTYSLLPAMSAVALQVEQLLRLLLLAVAVTHSLLQQHHPWQQLHL